MVVIRGVDIELYPKEIGTPSIVGTKKLSKPGWVFKLPFPPCM